MKQIFLWLIIGISVFTACQTAQEKASTPAEAVKSYAAAVGKKDFAAIKENLSAGSLKMLGEAAAAQNQSLEQFLTNNPNIFNANSTLLEFRNEQTDGTNAAVELKNPQTGTWDKVYLVKENERWKVALDKLLEETMKEVERETP